MEKIKIAITGHRPQDLYDDYDESNPKRLWVKSQIRNFLLKEKEKYKILGISGAALGTDQDFMVICIELDILFDAYIPFIGQELIWPKTAQKRYKELVAKARKCIVVSSGGYTPNKMFLRNKRMSEDCHKAIVVWNGKQKGGTWNCLQCLQSLKKEIIRINPNEYKISTL